MNFLKKALNSLKKVEIVSESPLTSSQFLSMILATALATNLCSGRSDLTSVARKSSFISIIIVAIYPLTIFFIYSKIAEKYPHQNLMEINIKILGSILGNIFNICIFFMIFTYSICTLEEITMISIQTVFWYLNSFQTIIILLSIAFFSSFYSLKGHCKTIQLMLFITTIAMFLNVTIFKFGDVKNLLPVFDVPIKNTIYASLHAIYPISGFELFVLYCPLLKEKSDFKKIGMKFTISIVIILVALTLLNEFYWGINLVNSLRYPIERTISLFKVPFITDSMFLFITIVLFFNFACFAILYRSCKFVLTSVFHSINSNLLVVILTLFIIIVAKTFSTAADLSNLVLFIYYPLLGIFVLNIVLILILERKLKL